MMRVVADLDGTLLSCEERHCHLMHYWAQACGQHFDSAAYWAWKRQGLSNTHALIRMGIGHNFVDVMCAGWLKDIEHWPWLGFDRVRDGVLDTLKSLRKNKVEIHVLTARREPVFLRQQLRRTGLGAWIDGLSVVLPDDQASGAKAACLRVLQPCAWIGDTESDALAALEARCMFWPLHGGMRAPSFWTNWLADQPDARGWTLSDDFRGAVLKVPVLEPFFADLSPPVESCYKKAATTITKVNSQ